MVDVGEKSVTSRTAIAEGRVLMKPETLALVLAGDAKKGDVLGTARLAGIMAAKRTSDLIPLCHPLLITKVTVDLTPDENLPGIHVRALVKVSGQTGVEMEALTAVSVACLTIYDMVNRRYSPPGKNGRKIRPLDCRQERSSPWLTAVFSPSKRHCGAFLTLAPLCRSRNMCPSGRRRGVC